MILYVARIHTSVRSSQNADLQRCVLQSRLRSLLCLVVKLPVSLPVCNGERSASCARSRQSPSDAHRTQKESSNRFKKKQNECYSKKEQQKNGHTEVPKVQNRIKMKFVSSKRGLAHATEMVTLRWPQRRIAAAPHANVPRLSGALPCLVAPLLNHSQTNILST